MSTSACSLHSKQGDRLSPALPLAQRRCLQHPDTYFKEARILLTLELLVGNTPESTNHAGLASLLSTHTVASTAQDPVLSKPCRSWQGLPYSLGCSWGAAHPRKKWEQGQSPPCQEKPHLGHHVLPEAVTRHRQLNYSRLLSGSAGVGGRGACAKDLGAHLGIEVTARGAHGSMASP